MKPDDIVELYSGVRLMIVSPERAAAVCKDVQLWFFVPSGYWRPEMLPSEFGVVPHAWYASHFPLPVAIEIDSPKSEYEPHDSSSPP